MIKRNRWIQVAAGLALGSLGGDSVAASLAEDLDASLLVDTEMAISTKDSDVDKSQVTLLPEATLAISPSLRLVGIGRARFDGADNLEPGRPDQLERDPISRRALFGDRAEAELRELYFDAFVGEVFLRIGKQQTVWGKADGLKVLDIVNPQSYREFVLEDYEDSRIPLWTVAGEIPVATGLLQLLWIPDQTYNELPDRDATYAFTTPRLVPQAPAGTSVRLEDPQRPDRTFKDSDAGMRFSAFASGWDLSANYFYHYGDNPAYARRIGPSGVTVTPEYRRTHTVGGSASNAFGDFTLRTELAYSTDRQFLTNDPQDTDGIFVTGETAYVVGLDWQGLSNTFISAQLFQSRLADDNAGLTRDVVDTNTTLLVERQMRHETLTARLFWIHGHHDDDGLLQPSLAYDVYGNLTLGIGADIFYGPSRGLFGEFNDTDRVTVSLEWGYQ